MTQDFMTQDFEPELSRRLATKQDFEDFFDKEEEPKLAIKLNNAATNDPCAICGERTDPICGPELFLAGSFALVCYECGERIAPELMVCLRARPEDVGP